MEVRNLFFAMTIVIVFVAVNSEQQVTCDNNNCRRYPSNCEIGTDNCLFVTWQFENNHPEFIEFEIAGPVGQGKYTSFGLTESGFMKHGLMYACVNSGLSNQGKTGIITAARVAPTIDAMPMFVNLTSNSKIGNVSSCRFRRPAKVERYYDSKKIESSLMESSYYVLFASGTIRDNEFFYHGHQNRGVSETSVNFTTSQLTSTTVSSSEATLEPYGTYVPTPRDTEQPTPETYSTYGPTSRGIEGSTPELHGTYVPTPRGTDRPTVEPLVTYAPTPRGTEGPIPEPHGTYVTTPKSAERPTPELHGTYVPTPRNTEGPTPEPHGTHVPTLRGTEGPTPEPHGTYVPTPRGTEGPTPEPRGTYVPTPRGTEGPTPEPRGTYVPTPRGTEGPTPEPHVTYVPTPRGTEGPTPEPHGAYVPTPRGTEGPTPEPHGTYVPTPRGTKSPTPEPHDTHVPTPRGTEGPTPEPRGTYVPTPLGTEGSIPKPHGTYAPKAKITQATITSPESSDTLGLPAGECGVSKQCKYFPENCNTEDPGCLFMSWRSSEEKGFVVFEISGGRGDDKEYVAMAFAEEPLMKNSDVYYCTGSKVLSAVVGKQHSSPVIIQNELNVTVAETVNGTARCVFERAISVNKNLDGVEYVFDLGKNNYYVQQARGKIEKGIPIHHFKRTQTEEPYMIYQSSGLGICCNFWLMVGLIVVVLLWQE